MIIEYTLSSFGTFFLVMLQLNLIHPMNKHMTSGDNDAGAGVDLV